jgi:hypothetical protein
VFEPDREQLDAYVRHVSDALGEPGIIRRHELPYGEWIEVVKFGGR